MYQPRHELPLPRILRGLIEPAGTRGYQPRHSKREDT